MNVQTYNPVWFAWLCMVKKSTPGSIWSDHAVSRRASARAKMSLRHNISTYTMYCPVSREIKCDRSLWWTSQPTKPVNFMAHFILGEFQWTWKVWRLGSVETWQSSPQYLALNGLFQFWVLWKNSQHPNKWKRSINLHPWKINMEPKTHPIEQENHLNRTSILGSSLIFQSVKLFDDS